MPGAPSGKKTSKGKERVEKSAHELRFIALEELALEHDLLPDRADLEAVERDSASSSALTLWTYVHELNRRAHFASQGEAVRSLWMAMDKKEREKINIDKVFKARDSVLTALRICLETRDRHSERALATARISSQASLHQILAVALAPSE